jgi:hypothetical protein
LISAPCASVKTQAGPVIMWLISFSRNPECC